MLHSQEFFGWLILALAPGAIFTLWWALQTIRDLRRAQLLGEGLDACGDAMAVISRRHVYLAVNDAYGRMLEMPPERIAGQSVQAIWGRTLYENVIQENLLRCFSGERVYGRAVVPLAGMNNRYIEVTYNPIVRRGRVIKVSAFLIDATRRVDAETALREREALYATLVESANSVILRASPEGRITFINSFGLKFFGYAEKELLDRHLLGLIIPEIDSEGRNLRLMWRNIVADIDNHALNKNENIRKDGARVWMLWSNRALRNEQGQITELLCIGNDVTLLEKSLRELEGLREALDQSGSGMAVTDLDGRIRFTNPAWTRMHGLHNGDPFAGTNVGECFDPMAEGIRLADMLGQVRTEGGIQAEMRHLRHDSSSFTALTTMTLLRDPAGNPDGLVFMAVDTTERKRLMADLDRSRQRLGVIVDNVDDIVFSLDPSGRSTFISPAVHSMFGYTPTDVEGRHFTFLIHPEDIIHCDVALEQLRVGTTPLHKLEVRGCRKNGTVIWLVIGLSGIFDEDKTLTQVVGVVRDITERRRMHEELRESQTRFQELVKAIEEAYWLQDGKRLLYTSPGFQPVFGLSGEELHESPARLLDVVHPEDRAIAEPLWDGRRATWALQDVTLRVLIPEQGMRWIRARTFPVVRNGIIVRTAGVAQDVTAYTEAVNVIRDAKEAAEQANKVKNEFLARMGHEFRTPLNGVLGMLQLLRISEQLDEENVTRVDEAERSARSLQNLLDRLLEFVALEGCEGGARNSPFSLRDLLRGLEATFAPLAHAKGLNLHIVSGKDLLDLVGDGAKIRRILDQLMDNALKFTDQGGIAVHVEQSATPGGTIRTVITVDDSGQGLPPDSKEDIFEPFVQADGSYTRRFGGAGLGLGIARQLSRCIGAELRVGTSNLGGTAFELCFMFSTP
ncbi:MAG: PAS domain S-box protein [Desulfovibrio sp.]